MWKLLLLPADALVIKFKLHQSSSVAPVRETVKRSGRKYTRKEKTKSRESCITINIKGKSSFETLVFCLIKEYCIFNYDI